MTDDATTGEARVDADAQTRAGVYANRVEVVLGEREVTFDFVRVDHDERAGGRAVLVARVALHFDTVLDLDDTLFRMAPLWRHRVGRVP